MNDLISRQAAIDALHTRFKDGFNEDKWRNSTHVLAAIEGLPPAQPEADRWIPVSERPKKDGRYQVTRLDYVTDTKFIDILWYEKNTWWNRRATGDYAVTAWRPLPEPYKAEEET